jgi:hypothetical protein
MFRRFMHSLLTALALLLACVPSSTLGASPSTARADGGASHRPRAVGRVHRHKRGAVVHGSRSPATAIGSTTTMLLGDNAAEPQYDLLAAGRAEAFRLRAGASGLVGFAHLYISGANAASTVVVGLYTNAGGDPGTLLSAGSVAASSPGTWTIVALTPVQLTAGTTYWLAVLGKGGVLRYRDRAHGRCPSQTSAQRTLSALPARWRTGTAYGDCPVSAYVTTAPSVPAVASDLRAPLSESAPTSNPPVAPRDPDGAPEQPGTPGLPAAPLNTVAPTITGSATEGLVLDASSGTWSGNPTSFSYQWEDCDGAGEACSSVSGATTSSYRLAARDVGHRLRVVVTASNAGGSAHASSAAGETVLQAAPSNSAPPTIGGSAFEGQTLKATTGTWTGSPTSYGYRWQDCDTQGESCSNVSGATSATYKLAAADVGHTMRVVVTASNAVGSAKASSAATAIVSAGNPPPAPTNTAPPAISGSAVEGLTLKASTGTWTGSPTSYAYQWQDCNSSGGGCSNIGGAVAGTRILAAGEVGHTLRVEVKATNAGGTGEATSAATSVVIAKEGGGTPTNCFAAPERCGYPGPNSTGPGGEGAAKCASLTASGPKTITKSGEKVEGLNITGNLAIDAAKVTVNDDCVTYNGKALEGSEAIRVEAAGDELTVSNTTIRGENEGTGSMEIALSNTFGATGLLATADDIYNCGECIHYAWTVRKSYVLNDGMRDTQDHYEDWYFNNNTIVAEEDTMFNPFPQTAVLFGNVNNGSGGACENHVTATHDFFAGGGWAAGYACANATSAGGSAAFVDDRFARCEGTAVEAGSGGHKCGPGEVESNEPGPGGDEHGYWPDGGYFGVFTAGATTSTWEGNFWDDDLEAVSP